MSVSKRESLVSTIIVTVQYLGLWYGEKRIGINTFAKLAISCYLSSYGFQLVALFIWRHDTKRLFECFSVISFCGMGILKLYSLSRKREFWLSLLNRMTGLEKGQLKQDELSIEEYQSDGDEEINHDRIQIRKYTDKFKWSSKILIKIYCFTGVIFILSPFVEYAFGVFLGKETEGYPHILPSWNPFDDVHFSCYVLCVICEVVAASYCVCVHIAFDSTVIGVIIFICGQFSLLIFRSERIAGSGKVCKLSRKRDLRAHFRNRKCHQVHLQLVSSIDDLDTLLHNILGFYFFLATLTLCSVAVRFKTETMSVMQLLSLLQYMGATLTQLYIYCSYGDAVFNESTITMAQGPFGAATWCLSPKIRRELAMLGVGMMKPRRLHAGPFNTVDLPSFIQIVRAAYSYYAVLGNNKQN